MYVCVCVYSPLLLVLAAYPGEKAQFCSSHKKPGMVDVHNKRCEAENCQKHPTYGLVNGRARFCTKHKGPNMVSNAPVTVIRTTVLNHRHYYTN